MVSTKSTDLYYAGTKLCKAQNPSLLKGKHKTTRDKREAAASVGGAQALQRHRWGSQPGSTLASCVILDKSTSPIMVFCFWVGVRATERTTTCVALCPE